MRFRNHTEDSGIPTIDLIPMLTVMMGVLAFFVVISVSLGSEQLIQVDLPPEQNEDTPQAQDTIKEPFIVEMNAEGQQILNGEPISNEQLTARIQTYLAQNTDSIVYLVPSQQLPYEQVMRFLGDMRSIGGDRVSLALESNDQPPSANKTPLPDN